MASKIVSKLVKPPVSIFGIEGRYINALYSAASKNNKLESVEGDLKKLCSLYKSDPKFKEFLINPLIHPSQKSKVFENDLKTKLKLTDLSVNLLSAMSENRRLTHLPVVEAGFNQIMSNLRNELACTVKSAKELSETKRKEVEESLKAFTKKKLLLKFETDPSILGGIIVDFNGEHYIDMSLKSKLKQYSDCIRSL